MKSEDIQKNISHLELLESVLFVIKNEITVSPAFIAEKLDIKTKKIEKLLLDLSVFKSERLLNDLNAGSKNTHTLNEVEAVLRVFNAHISLKENESQELSENFLNTIDYFLYAIKVELQNEKINLKETQIKEARLKKEAEEREAKIKEEEARQKEIEMQIAKEKAEREELITKFHNDNVDLINKFLNISARKVSILNEYGFEDYEALYKEIAEVLKIILIKDRLYSLSYVRKLTLAYLENPDRNFLPYPYDLYVKYLENLFRTTYSKQDLGDFTEIASLNGLEFEGFLMSKFKSYGVYEVSGTPITGDQGADILLHKGNNTIAIQVKHHQNPVGNSAIQEIAGALKYYNANKGAVITSGTFTPAAKALAQKNNILLVDKYNITELPNLFNFNK